MKKERNVWKWAFLSLITTFSLLLIVIAMVFFLLFPKERDKLTNEFKDAYGETLFVISTTKEQLNRFLSQQVDSDTRDFQIMLEESVILEGTVPVFGRSVQYELKLQPELYGDGNLMLKSKGFHLGELQLPSEMLFLLLKNTIHFPEWIEIYPKEKQIFLNVTEISALETLTIKITTFDLEKDIIEFELVGKASNIPQL